MPSLTVEASFNGDTAELVVSGELDPAATTVVSDMLDLAMGRRPRTLVLRMREAGPVDGPVAQMIADAARRTGAARPVIFWRSLPVRALVRRTGPLPVRSFPPGVPAGTVARARLGTADGGIRN